MELRHLRYFIAAAEEEHFGRASERVHVTRPAISGIIADLESELGTPLFERLAHRVKLTAAGQALLPRFQTIMGDLNETISMMKRIGEGKSGTLKIGYGSLTLLHSLFRATIKQFKETHPDVDLALLEMPTSLQPKALVEGKIDAGFMHFGPRSSILRRRRKDGPQTQDQDHADLDWLRIQTGGLGVAMPNDHPLAKRKSVTLAELGDESFVVVPHSISSPNYGQIYALCQKAGFEPKIVQEVGTISSQLNLISVGMGIGLAVIGRNFVYPNSLAVVPLEQISYTNSFVFAWIKGQKDPALDRMIDIVKVLSKGDSR
jgi:DNA-binding transcriptional LysR family regulator